MRTDMERERATRENEGENVSSNSLGPITYEDAEEEQECIELVNKRNEKTPKEPDISQGTYVISVRHVSRGLIRRLFERESLMMDVYNWVGSLSPEPKYFELRNLPNYVVSKTETVEHCKDVLHMYAIDGPVESLEDRDSQKQRSNVSDTGDEETDLLFETFKPPDDRLYMQF